jgi:hypothetical protein
MMVGLVYVCEYDCDVYMGTWGAWDCDIATV